MADLTGQRVRQAGQPEIYVMIDGKRCHIPDEETYSHFYASWDGIVDVPNILDIPQGDSLSVGALMARAGTSPDIYMISNGIKRHITGTQNSPRGLDLSRTIVVEPSVMKLISTGMPL